MFRMSITAWNRKVRKGCPTFSKCNTNNLFWCISSKGNFMENIAIDTTAATLTRSTIRRRTLCPNRWAKGRTRGRAVAPMLDAIVAMRCSAGASAPMRPVCTITLLTMNWNLDQVVMRMRAHQRNKHLNNRNDN